MPFPDTRLTLIQRLARGGELTEWRDFLDDYWGPVCRFARRRGTLSADDAEDVAAQSLEAIIRNRLLSRWSTNQSAKLRTLICAVVRNVMSNRARVETGRTRVVQENGDQLARYRGASVGDASNPGDGAPGCEPVVEPNDAFYSAWAEDVVQVAVETLLTDYMEAGKGDHFRVLYGRLCDSMSMAEIAEALQISVSTADSYFRHARERLTRKLQEVLRQHVLRYSAVEQVDAEFQQEWNRLGEHLRAHGGLDAAVRESYAAYSPQPARRWANRVNLETMTESRESSFPLSAELIGSSFNLPDGLNALPAEPPADSLPDRPAAESSS